MISGIKVKNFRSFDDSGLIDIKPLTIFLGANSSGKSTILRTFPLLKQSSLIRKTNIFIWSGHFVDFGNINDIVNKNSKKSNVIISIKTTPPKKRVVLDDYGEGYMSFITSKLGLNTISSEIDIIVKQDSNNSTILERINITIHGNVLSMIFKGDSITSVTVNGEEFVNLYNNIGFLIEDNILPIIINTRIYNSSFSVYSSLYALSAPIMNKMLDFFVSKDGRLKPSDKLKGLLRRFIIQEDVTMLRQFKDYGISPAIYYISRGWRVTNPDFIRIKNLLIAYHLPMIFNYYAINITAFARGIKYISPLRSQGIRYNRFQDILTDEIDSKGENLAMYIYNMTKSELAEFNSWIYSTLNINVFAELTNNNVELKISFGKNREKFNIIDIGFGYSQILPIIIQLWEIIWDKKRSKQIQNSFCVVIEQPELHLHPKMQKDLIDCFINLIKYCKDNNIDIKLLIETHSEYMINQIGAQIYNKSLDRDSVIIHLVEKEDNFSTIKQSHFDDDGYLTDWPYGFMG